MVPGRRPPQTDAGKKCAPQSGAEKRKNTLHNGVRKRKDLCRGAEKRDGPSQGGPRYKRLWSKESERDETRKQHSRDDQRLQKVTNGQEEPIELRMWWLV